MPKFKIVNNDGSTSDFKTSTPPAPVVYETPPKIIPKKVEPKVTVTNKPASKPGPKPAPKPTDDTATKATPKPVTKAKPVSPNTPVKENNVPDNLRQPMDEVIKVFPKPITKEETKAEPRAKSKTESKTKEETPILKPIKRRRGSSLRSMRSTPSESTKAYILDQKGIDTLVNAVVTSLEDKFVSKDEVQGVVEKVLQKMLIENDLQ